MQKALSFHKIVSTSACQNNRVAITFSIAPPPYSPQWENFCLIFAPIGGRVIYQRKKTEPSVLLLSLGFEKLKVLFWATYDGRIFSPFFFSLGYALPVVG